MAQTIQILNESLANKIAAGEVVQRPASAVKELIENAIDAHAKAITIVIKEGGKKLIQVIDDGDGMSDVDAKVAFQRHATSKISTYEDLECIKTLGFRGEALASIAAVGQVELRTRQVDSAVGIKVKVEGGARREISPDACPKGTSIQVHNLFYNTPGRRNFLKSTNTEYRHIYDVIQRVSISHPDIEIKFVSDNESILSLRPDSYQSRIGDVFGKKLSESLVYFEDENNQVAINGFLGKPDFARKGKAEQYLFLNGRFILSRNISHAVYQAYEHLVEKGSFPLFILFLNIDPKKIDVNVHPSKMEVKFEDESSIYRAVLYAARHALSSQDLIPSIKITDREIIKSEVKFKFGPTVTQGRDDSFKKILKPFSSTNGETNSNIEDNFTDETASVGQIELQGIQTKYNAMWQFQNKYIIFPTDEGLMIVDQHAAHERVLYERVRHRFTNRDRNSQQLLFPHTIQLTAGDAVLINELKSNLEMLGFNLKFFGKTTVILDGVPPEIKPGNEAKVLQDILDLYKEDDNEIKIEPSEKLAKSFSCKAAIKAGDPLGMNEMQMLIEQLFATEIPFVCPHGRPISIKLTLNELDHKFGRTS